MVQISNVRKRKYAQSDLENPPEASPEAVSLDRLCVHCDRELPFLMSILQIYVGQLPNIDSMSEGLHREFSPDASSITCSFCRMLLSTLKYKSLERDETIRLHISWRDIGTVINEDASFQEDMSFYCLHIRPSNLPEARCRPVDLALLPSDWTQLQDSREKLKKKSETHEMSTAKVHPPTGRYRSFAPRLALHNQVNYALVSSWIGTCKKFHKKACCFQPSRDDVDQPDRGKPIWLIDCATRLMKKSFLTDEYVTLSYVWGESGGEARPASRWILEEDASLPDCLPLTVEDAITVTLKLGYTYLWVDQYCIDQSSNGQHKWEQMKIMDLIYGASDLTIINAAGAHANHGLPGVGSVTRSAQAHFAIAPGFEVVEILRRPEEAIRSSKWASRGWTFQEGILALRRLVFTEAEMYFECGRLAASESMHRPFSELPNTSKQATQTGAPLGYFATQCDNRTRGARGARGRKGVGHGKTKFQKALHNYLDRQLTFEKDRLFAFKGYIEAMYPSRNAYGLPLVGFTDDSILSSVVEDDPPGNSFAVVALSRALSWRASKASEYSKRRTEFPSFSWTGWHEKPDMRAYGFIDSQINLPGLTLQALVQDEPSEITLRAQTSRIILCRDDSQLGDKRKGILVPKKWQDGRSRCEISLQGIDLTSSEEFAVELLILFETRDVQSTDRARSGLIILLIGLLFQRKDRYVERMGHLEIQLGEKGSDEESLTRSGLKGALERPLEWETLRLR